LKLNPRDDTQIGRGRGQSTIHIATTSAHSRRLLIESNVETKMTFTVHVMSLVALLAQHQFIGVHRLVIVIMFIMFATTIVLFGQAPSNSLSPLSLET
jgi:hypothetical protein